MTRHFQKRRDLTLTPEITVGPTKLPFSKPLTVTLDPSRTTSGAFLLRRSDQTEDALLFAWGEITGPKSVPGSQPAISQHQCVVSIQLQQTMQCDYIKSLQIQILQIKNEIYSYLSKVPITYLTYVMIRKTEEDSSYVTSFFEREFKLNTKFAY